VCLCEEFLWADFEYLGWADFGYMVFWPCCIFMTGLSWV
jgi:hypothetical protein